MEQAPLAGPAAGEALSILGGDKCVFVSPWKTLNPIIGLRGRLIYLRTSVQRIQQQTRLPMHLRKTQSAAHAQLTAIIPNEGRGSIVGVLNHIAGAENWYFDQLDCGLQQGQLPISL